MSRLPLSCIAWNSVACVSNTLAQGGRVEIRGFGTFSLHRRQSRVSRNRITGAPVALPKRQVPHFKLGKELRERVNSRRLK
jgi:integration host factor subunit beta